MSTGKRPKKKKNKKKNNMNRPSPAAAKKKSPPVTEETSRSAAEEIPTSDKDTAGKDVRTTGAEGFPEETASSVPGEARDDPPAEGSADGQAQTVEERLRDLRPDDIKGDGAPSRRAGRGGILALVTFVLCIAVSAGALFLLGRNLYAKYRGQTIYDRIADAFDYGMTGDRSGPVAAKTSPATLTMDEIIKNNSEGKGALDGEHSEELSRLRATLTSLKKENPDTYGWIKVEGTNINYPVVKRGDNDYYLDHAYTGEYLPVGAIFADYRTSDTFSDNVNLVIYGHNVTTGSMFGSLKDFLDKDVFYSNRIYLYTMEGIFEYRPFSIHETAYDSGYIDTGFESWDAYVKFLEELAADSKLKVPDGVIFDENTRILTLSTCTNGAADNRLALHAVLESSVTD